MAGPPAIHYDHASRFKIAIYACDQDISESSSLHGLSPSSSKTSSLLSRVQERTKKDPSHRFVCLVMQSLSVQCLAKSSSATLTTVAFQLAYITLH